MKIGLWVEGETDKNFYLALVSRVLGIERKNIMVRNRRGRCIQGLRVGLSGQLKEFAELGCSHVILSADNHGSTPGKAARHKREAKSLVTDCPCVMGVAIQELEAWLLADYVTLSQVLGKPNIDKPPSVEDLPHPKKYLYDLLGLYPNASQLSNVAQRMDLVKVRREAPSFDHFLRALSSWKTER